jgi:hypothetical protein
MALALLLVARDSVDCSASTTEKRLERVRSIFGTGRRGQLIVKRAALTNDNGADGKVACRSRLGGLLNYYYREAA